tara:strand:- start:4856 stop:6715 length:1860 start_codon:yes stop_codon:yes gene_type:complete
MFANLFSKRKTDQEIMTEVLQYKEEKLKKLEQQHKTGKKNVTYEKDKSELKISIEIVRRMLKEGIQFNIEDEVIQNIKSDLSSITPKNNTIEQQKNQQKQKKQQTAINTNDPNPIKTYSSNNTIEYKSTFKQILKGVFYTPLVGVNIQHIAWIFFVLVILYLFFSLKNPIFESYDAKMKKAEEQRRREQEELEQEELDQEELEQEEKEAAKKKQVAAFDIYMENNKQNINDITDLAILEFLGTTALTQNSAIYKFFNQVGDDLKTKDEIIIEFHKTKTKFNLLLIYENAIESNLDLKGEFKFLNFDKFTFDFKNLQELTKNIDSEFDEKITSERDIIYMNIKINDVITKLRNQKKNISYENIEKIKQQQQQQQIQINTESNFYRFKTNEKKFLNFVKTNTQNIKLSEEIINDVKKIYDENFSENFISFEDAIGKILDKHYEILRNKNFLRNFKTNVETFSNSLLGMDIQFKTFLPNALKETMRNAMNKVDGYGYLQEDEKRYTNDVMDIKIKIAIFLKKEKETREEIEKKIEYLTDDIMERIAKKKEDQYFVDKNKNQEEERRKKEVDALVQAYYRQYYQSIPSAPTTNIIASRDNNTNISYAPRNNTYANQPNKTALI